LSLDQFGRYRGRGAACRADLLLSWRRALVYRIGNSVTFWPEGGERLSGSVDFAQDVFALGLPQVASRIFIACRQERDDRVGEFSGRGKALLADELGQVAKEALDQIHPG